MNKKSPRAQNRGAVPSAEPPKVSYPRLLWQGTCTRFTVIALCALVVNILLSDTDVSVEPWRFLLFLPFAFCLTLATLTRRSTLSAGARAVLHPLCSLGGFYLCLYLPYQLTVHPTGAQFLIVILLAAMVYGIVVGILALVGRRSRQKRIDETPYVSQFGSK